MPAVSRNQRIAMAIAEHHPEKLKARNRGLLKWKTALEQCDPGAWCRRPTISDT
jgi:hypothetical protein